MKKIKQDWNFFLSIFLGIALSVILSIYVLDIKKETLSNIETNGFIGTSIVVCIIVFVILTIIHYKKDIKQEQIFLYTIPIVCILFIIVMPMFKSHDEHAHWHRIYEISTGNLATDVKEDGGTISILPKSVVCRDWVDMDYSEVIADLYNKIDNSDTTDNVYIVTASMYSPIQYAHEAIVIAIARIFVKIPILLAYSGRIANMLLCVGLIYFSIKKMPFGKNIILCISYIPILIEGISSMSGDGITFSICLFFIAYLFNLIFNKEVTSITKKDKIVLGILSVIIASCKIVYLPMIGLLLLLPKEKMKDKKDKIITISILWGIALIASLAWLIYSSRYLSALANLSQVGDVTTQEKILSILTNPISYVQRILYDIELNGGTYIKEAFGSSIGWYNFVSLNTIIPYTLLMIFSIIAITDNSVKDKFNKFQKIIITLVILAIVLLIFTSLYIQWTKPETKSIDGIQGRYFIPILPLFGMLIAGCNKIKWEYKQVSQAKVISYIGMILQIQFILQVYISNI